MNQPYRQRSVLKRIPNVLGWSVDRLVTGRDFMGGNVGRETAQGAFDLGRALRCAANPELRSDP
jgi:hypothetical protein